MAATPVQAKKKLEIAPAARDTDPITCATFVLHDEDHTLGNALRYMIMKNPDVEFCGYSIPHPSETKIHLRIQTKGKPASEILRIALDDLEKMCEHIGKTFDHSFNEFSANSSSAMDTN
eukprot:Opistho-2@3489